MLFPGIALRAQPRLQQLRASCCQTPTLSRCNSHRKRARYNPGMRIFWRTLAVFGGVVLLLLIAVAIAVHTVDVKEFIGPIQQRVKDATGRDLEVRGGIDLKLGLEPKLVLDDVTLGNAPWSKQPQMLTAKHVEAQIALLPLLRKRFEVIRFKLIEPTIVLETDSGGKGNWEFPALPAAAQGSTPAPSGGTLGGFAVGDIAISNGAVTYRDGKTGEITTILIEDLTVHARDAQSPVSGRFRGKVNDTAVALEGDFGPLDQLMRQRWPYPVTVQGEINGKKASVGTQVTVQGNVVGLDDLKIGSGSSAMTGKMAVVTGGPLSLPDSRHLEQVHVQLTLVNGKLDVPVMQATALGGTVLGRLQLDASRAPDAALSLHVDAKNLDLGALLAAAGVKRELHGGKTEVKADISARGASPRQWASSANGNVIAVVGPATVVNPKGSTDVPLDRLLEAVNPFRSVDPSTQLQCAVIRLPLKNGVASIDRSIAAETNKLGATASGTLDFRSETLDLSIKPQIRQGIPIAVPQVAELVRFHGPFTSPSVGIDATATAATVARLGAAVYTGGLSIIGESLIAQATADPSAPCQIALGRGAAANIAASKSATNANPTATAAEGVGKALGHLLGR